TDVYQRTAGRLGSKVGGYGGYDKIGAKLGRTQAKADNVLSRKLRADELQLTKNPASWVRHPISTIKQVGTSMSETANVRMNQTIKADTAAEYRRIGQSEGLSGKELDNYVEFNTITDPQNIA